MGGAAEEGVAISWQGLEGKEGMDSELVVMPGYKVWQRGRSGAGSQGSGLGPSWVVMPFAKPELVLGPVVSADTSLIVFQVNEIYHDESLGAHINVVLVRIILLSYGKVSGRCRLVPSRHARAPASVG